MNFQKESNRVYLEENGKLLAEITFPLLPDDNGTVVFNHTFVDNSLRGQGVADKLVREALAIVRENDWKVTATCSYVVSWLERNKS